MTTETEVEICIAREINARVRRTAWRIGIVAVLVNVAAAAALWGTLTAKANADIRREIGKISDSYIRREAASIQGAADAALERTTELRDLCRDIHRAAAQTREELVENVLQNERAAMALDEQKMKQDQRRTQMAKRPAWSPRQVALSE